MTQTALAIYAFSDVHLRLVKVITIGAVLGCSWLRGAAQDANRLSPAQVQAIVRQVSIQQTEYLTRKGAPLRFQVHRVDSKEDSVRDVIASRDGNVARQVLHRGIPLSSGEDAAEQARLRQMLSSNALKSKMKEDQRVQGYGVELIHAMPDAMTYAMTPGQPQLPGLDRPQYVFDFVPNPAYRSATTAESLLSGLSGRLWVDQTDHHLVRIEIDIHNNLNLAWGLLVHVYSGGRIEYDQRRISDDLYAYTHIRTHLRLRELMLRTVPFDSEITASNFQVLPTVPTGEEAIRMLLERHVPVAP